MIFYETFLGSQRLINNRFKIVEELRAGTQAKRIFEVRDINSGDEFTLYLFDVGPDAESRIHFFDQASQVTGRRIRHLFFSSSPFYFLKGPDEFGVAVDWCDGHDFYEETAGMNIKAFLKAVHELAEELAALHKIGIFHLDVKEENVIYRGGRPCLIDFGSAKCGISVSETESLTLPPVIAGNRSLLPVKSFSRFEINSTDIYRPPETLVELELHDSFSMGQIIFHCLTSEYYQPSKRYLELEQFQNHFGLNIADLCFGLTDIEMHRYTVQEILAHPAFSETPLNLIEFKLAIEDSRRKTTYNSKDSAQTTESMPQNCMKSSEAELLKFCTPIGKDKLSVGSVSLTALSPRVTNHKTALVTSSTENGAQPLDRSVAHIRHKYWEDTEERINCLNGEDSDAYSETASHASSISIFMQDNQSKESVAGLDFEFSDDAERMHELECDLSEFHLDLAECDFSS